MCLIQTRNGIWLRCGLFSIRCISALSQLMHLCTVRVDFFIHSLQIFPDTIDLLRLGHTLAVYFALFQQQICIMVISCGFTFHSRRLKNLAATSCAYYGNYQRCALHNRQCRKGKH